jgi:hypothetical protein
MLTRDGWVVLGMSLLLGCSTLSPAERAQKNYERATATCWFQHGYDEASVKGPGVGTSSATGTTDSPIDVALRECLARAAVTRDRELAEASVSK